MFLNKDVQVVGSIALNTEVWTLFGLSKLVLFIGVIERTFKSDKISDSLLIE